MDALILKRRDRQDAPFKTNQANRERPAVRNMFESSLCKEEQQPMRNPMFQQLTTQIRSLITQSASKNDGFVPSVSFEQEQRIKQERAYDRDDSKTIID